MKIYDRASAISKRLVGTKVRIHNGKRFKRLSVNKYMIGYKFGEFAFTRKPFHFPLKKKKKKKR